MNISNQRTPLRSSAQPIPASAVGEIILRAPAASITSIAGIGSEQLRLLLDNSEQKTDNRLALFLPLSPHPTAEMLIEQNVGDLAKTALQMWPVWYTNVDFAECRNDALGREAARVIIRKAANDITAISRAWADVAVMLALEGRRPRVDSTPIATQLEQLCLAINRGGLIFITEIDPNAPNGGALVHALEWLSHHSQVSIVALFAEQPLRQPPFDRLLYGLRVITGEDIVEPVPIEQRRGHEHPWLAPIRGMPHPLSETEKRLAKHLARDGELGPLFGFNQCVETIRGTRPKVDLLWTVGRLVVELDGYSDHGTRPAFMYDRHRDYELTLSGYTVLRIANEEVVQDIEKAVEKIRDVVHLCRMRQQREN